MSFSQEGIISRSTFIYDSDLDAMVQIRGPGSNHYEEPSGVQIIRDIEPYRAAGSDIAANGKRPVISGRRQHREFLRRNGYAEVGNEVPVASPRHWAEAKAEQRERVQDIRRALGDYGSNTGR
jgi:hypothetical protein